MTAMVNIFLAYTYKDQPVRDALAAHFDRWRLQGEIANWHEQATGPGNSWAGSLNGLIDASQLILLLISPDFLNSTYCYGAEMRRALERHSSGQARVLPILVRPVDWEETPFAGLPVLPNPERPISAWTDRDEALREVVAGIEEVLRIARGEEPERALPAPRPSDALVTSSDIPPLWSVPYRRNPFFGGRERLLKRLHDLPIANKATASTPPQVISGPAGVGKTELALEYAYRYRAEYRVVFWINATSRELLLSEFARIAGLLRLPEGEAPNQQLAVRALQRWLQATAGWLLILDNAPDLGVREFLPARGRGHVMLITRRAAPERGTLNVELQRLENDEGARFLLRRAGLPAEAPEADRRRARELAAALHGLPLALDLAGAYLEATQCSLSAYLNLFREERLKQQRQRNGRRSEVPEEVAAALALSLKRVASAQPVAEELLQTAAFLQPDAIAEELLAQAGPTLQEAAQDWFAWHAILHELRRYALVQRMPGTRSLALRRLTQLALRERLDSETERRLITQAVCAVERVFPACATPQLCQRYLPHALAAVRLSEQGRLETPEAARLLEKTGAYFQKSLQYARAEELLSRALALRERYLGAEQPALLPFLYNLARFYDEQGRQSAAETLYSRVLALQERVQGARHPDLGYCLARLGVLARDRGDYARAELHFKRVLEIWARGPQAERPELAAVYCDLGTLRRLQGDYAQAETLYRRALALGERVQSAELPIVARASGALGGLFHAQGKFEQAEELYLRARTILESLAGPPHPDLPTTLNNLAALYHRMRRDAEAEALYEQALALYERICGPEHPHVASCLQNFAILLHDRGAYERAEACYQRALEICERHAGPQHPAVAVCLNNLATLYTTQRKYYRAKALFKRALTIGERTCGPRHPLLAQFLENYAALLLQTHEHTRAAALRERARTIRMI